MAVYANVGKIRSAGTTTGSNSPPRWKVEQIPDGTFRWTTPSGRQYVTEPTRYPI